MRNAFAREITRLAALDERIVLLSGDIGNKLFDAFKERAPQRFFNCGVAEANMVGMAAGMALSGLRPVAYTIAPFITTRCLEQIRVDVCYHAAPVVLVGTGAGLSYAGLGATHHSCEDLALMRALPAMTVLAPGDALELEAALRAALAHDGPVYMRIGKKGEPVVHERPPDLRIGKGIVVRAGQDICLLSTGNMLPAAVAASERIGAARGTPAQVVSLPTVKPLDEALLDSLFATFTIVATIEEHSACGGLGGAVAEWLADREPGRRAARLVRIGTPDAFFHDAGEQEHLRRIAGLSPEDIARRLLQT